MDLRSTPAWLPAAIRPDALTSPVVLDLPVQQHCWVSPGIAKMLFTVLFGIWFKVVIAFLAFTSVFVKFEMLNHHCVIYSPFFKCCLFHLHWYTVHVFCPLVYADCVGVSWRLCPTSACLYYCSRLISFSLSASCWSLCWCNICSCFLVSISFCWTVLPEIRYSNPLFLPRWQISLKISGSIYLWSMATKQIVYNIFFSWKRSLWQINFMQEV